MARPRKQKPGFLALQRRHLDARFAHSIRLRDLAAPKKGWIKAIRTALGMTARQLGSRLHITPQGVLDLERREADETITLDTLRKAANALNADLLVAVIPRKPLEQIVHSQALSKANDDRNRLIHTMRLESQEAGTEDALDQRKSVENWLTTRIGKLWD